MQRHRNVTCGCFIDSLVLELKLKSQLRGFKLVIGFRTLRNERTAGPQNFHAFFFSNKWHISTARAASITFNHLFILYTILLLKMMSVVKFTALVVLLQTIAVSANVIGIDFASDSVKVALVKPGTPLEIGLYYISSPFRSLILGFSHKFPVKT